MKKKLLVALTLAAVVLTGCGTSQNAELSQTEIEKEKFTLPVECRFSCKYHSDLFRKTSLILLIVLPSLIFSP